MHVVALLVLLIALVAVVRVGEAVRRGHVSKRVWKHQHLLTRVLKLDGPHLHAPQAFRVVVLRLHYHFVPRLPHHDRGHVAEQASHDVHESHVEAANRDLYAAAALSTAATAVAAIAAIVAVAAGGGANQVGAEGRERHRGHGQRALLVLQPNGQTAALGGQVGLLRRGRPVRPQKGALAAVAVRLGLPPFLIVRLEPPSWLWVV
mmetsp:Transcript_49869/g.100361  ORF Transcript_49869/g.100361 Transcript_49869/m.100361 type:complete len:205 (-) Transcript_49869:554-1168(-)